MVDLSRILKRRTHHGVTEQRPHQIEQFLLHRLVLVDLRGNKAQEFERRRKAAFGQRLDGLIKHRQKRRGRRKVHDGWRHRNNKSIRRARSEEHTSELQSLMRISYAVFCLKKKNPQPTKTNNSKT